MQSLRILAVLVALALAPVVLHGAGQSGKVTFNGIPIPGATVRATHGDQRVVVTTGGDGGYHLTGLADGVWTIQIEMRGFAALSQEVTLSGEAAAVDFALTLLPFDEMAREATRQAPVETAAAPPAAARNQTAATPPRQAPRPAASPAGAPAGAPQASRNDPPAEDPAQAGAAADGLLINGSVNNGASSPFAQLAAFGNNRRGRRSLYNGGVGVVLGNSAWDARPFSFTGVDQPAPSYNDLQIQSSFAGPVRLPGITRSGPQVFVGYQRSVDHNVNTYSALLPTLAERSGDFSSSVDSLGRPVQVIDPTTGQAFRNNQIPRERQSAQALGLLNLYPEPNVTSGGRYNYQTPVLNTTESDAMQFRASQTVGRRDSLFGNWNYYRATSESTGIFGFLDSNRVAGTDAAINWQHRFVQFANLRFKYQFTRQSTEATPFFANHRNVSGDAGIAGNNQDPENWGPPALTFSSGIAGLSSGQYARNANDTHLVTGEFQQTRGRHGLTIGGGAGRVVNSVFSQQNARGSFGFTGVVSGSAFGDFLLGMPATSAIAFGNADKDLRGTVAHAFVVDDYRVSPSLTLNLGLRWEYESPLSESQGRLVNLDIAPGFGSVAAVTGDGLIHADPSGLQPRLGAAWRPVAGSSLVIRAGYGIYRNTGVYTQLALLLAQQPPFSRTSSVTRSAANPLTLANGFVTPTGVANTFAIDPEFRVGSAQIWQASAQRDLPGSLTVIATYVGTKGSHLMQEFLPNTYPNGALNPCALCPSGFVYLTSDGTSIRNSGSVQVRRRLRNGLTASVQYTLAKATDNASAFVPTGSSTEPGATNGIGGAVIAQDWLDLDAEHAPSSFDQRHQVTAQVQYTTGQGLGGGALMTGWRGSAFKGWTATSQITVGSGLPVTPIVLTPVGTTGVTGTVRASLTGVSPDPLTDDSYVNPAAFTAPASGQWGNAGRNSLRGPAQFSMNLGLSRSFLMGERYSFDWRIDITNVLNQVTYSSINTIVGSPQFGLPDRANSMRKILSTMRFRF